SAMEAAKAASSIAHGIADQAVIFASLHHIGIVLRARDGCKFAIEMHEKCFAIESPELDAKLAGWAAHPSVMLRTFLADSLIEIGELERAEIMANDAFIKAEDRK